MGRVKLKIKRLESTSNQQVTYSKRRNGILKKARELSILCDIDIILLMFSPTGKPTLFHGQRSNIEDIVARFSRLTPQERAKRKLESLEVRLIASISYNALKKTFKKLDHDVNIQEFLGASTQTVEELTDQIRLLQAQLTEVHKRLSYWSNPGSIDSIENLREMENSLRESINRIHLHKENFGKHRLMPLEFPSQNGTHLPLMMSGVQENQPLSWLPNNDNTHILVANEPNFLPQSDMGCLEHASISGYSGFMGTGKEIVVSNSGHADNIGQRGCSLNELSTSAGLSLQLGEPYSYPHYGSLNLPEDKKLKPEMEMNLQGNPAVYQVNSNFELPRPMFGDGHHDWVSASGPCGIALFDENSYHHQQNRLS